MRLFIVLVLGCLAGCATSPSPDPWADIEVQEPGAIKPLSLPEFPSPVSMTEDTVTFDLDGANAVSAYIVVAEGNTDIGAAHAMQIDDLRIAAKALVEAGKAQRKVADLRQEILEEERPITVISSTAIRSPFYSIQTRLPQTQ